jgi:single-stranded DNA-binding protein
MVMELEPFFTIFKIKSNQMEVLRMYVKDEGNLVLEIKPETIDTDDGSVILIHNRIAFNSYSRKEKKIVPTFVSVTFFGWQAEWLVRFVLNNENYRNNGKGARLCVGGELFEEEYKNKNGEKVKALRLEPDFVKYSKFNGSPKNRSERRDIGHDLGPENSGPPEEKEYDPFNGTEMFEGKEKKQETAS